MDDLMQLDAIAQAELVRVGDVSPLELVDAAIEKIEKLNPALNAVVTPMFEIARKVAKGRLPDGPLKGVPFLLKDLLAEVSSKEQPALGAAGRRPEQAGTATGRH